MNTEWTPVEPPSLTAFVEKTSGLVLEYWQKIICDRLEAMTHQEGQRLLVHGPPQFGKSVLISQRFPVYNIGINPASRVRVACYNVHHAERFSKVNLELMRSPIYHEFFPDPGTKVPAITSTSEWSTAARSGFFDANPSFKALGLGTGFTGLGVDCFTGETLISTEYGTMTLHTLYGLSSKPRVWAFDHKAERVTLRKVEATRRVEVQGLVEIRTTNGRTARCTPDHRIYVAGRGYTRASCLKSGDRLVALRENMLIMRGASASRRRSLPGMQLEEKVSKNSAFVRILQQTIHEVRKRSGQARGTRLPGHLLLPSLLERAYADKTCYAALSTVRRSFDWARAQWEKVLLQGVREGSKTSKKNKTLFFLRSGIHSQNTPDTVLLGHLRGRGAQRTYAGQEQPAFQDRNQLIQVVRRDASAYPGAGQLSLCSLRERGRSDNNYLVGSADKAKYPCHSPHRRRAPQQQAGKSRNSVQDMPCTAPQVCEDTVAMVTPLRAGCYPVYDLQVEEDCNFFTSGFLSHNCLIVDDPYKDRVEARSEATNKMLWGWWNDIVIPRMNPATNVVVMFHRWWDGDFAGKLLEQKGWESMRFPAIGDGGADDPTGRGVGELLSPRYTLPYLENIRSNKGTSFDALYQGTPYPATGSMFKAGKVGWVKAVPNEARRVRKWDVASTSGGGDYSVGVLMARAGNRYYVEDLVYGQWEGTERDEIILETARRDDKRYRGAVLTLVPQDPGSAGKDMAAAFVRLLAGFAVRVVAETGRVGDKEARADPFASQWNAGDGQNVWNVALLEDTLDNPWNDWYLSCMTAFPFGKVDDPVDASSGAFKWLAGKLEAIVEAVSFGPLHAANLSIEERLHLLRQQQQQAADNAFAEHEAARTGIPRTVDPEETDEDDGAVVGSAGTPGESDLVNDLLNRIRFGGSYT